MPEPRANPHGPAKGKKPPYGELWPSPLLAVAVVAAVAVVVVVAVVVAVAAGVAPSPSRNRSTESPYSPAQFTTTLARNRVTSPAGSAGSD